MISVFADGADLATMKAQAERGYVEGWTTNPSLMKKSGITDYREFARKVLETVPPLPVSFEVLARDVEGMIREAVEIDSWGSNVYVKIPIMAPGGEFTGDALRVLSSTGVKLNVTAITTVAQVEEALASLEGKGHILSVFAGRIADSGVDPEPIVKQAATLAKGHSILWASPREIFNLIQAERCGAEIITLTPELLAKIEGFGRDLTGISLATVRQFAQDAEGIKL